MNGTFIGGVDIVMELIEGDEFDSMVPTICKKKQPEDEISDCLKEHKVVALIKGIIDQPDNDASD